MLNHLGDPIAKFFIFPIVTVILSAFIKISSVNDKYSPEKSEWFYLGPDMLSAALLLVLIELCNTIKSADSTTQIQDGVVYSLLLCGCSLLFMPLLIRKHGCKGSNRTKGITHRLWPGIIIPDVWGIGLLYGILYFLSK